MKNEIWNEERLRQLVAGGAEESIHLEFKDGAAIGNSPGQKQTICRTVASFANSDGGAIIYGVAEQEHKAGWLSPLDGNVYTKEWLENVITSGVQQKIEELIIHAVRLEKAEQTIYIIEIPVSYRAPHMVNGIFYKRNNFKCVPMEEYEVRQLYHRKQRIILENKQIQVSIKNTTTWQKDDFFEFQFDFNVKNIGNIIAENYRLRCDLPKMKDLNYQLPKNNHYGYFIKDKTAFIYSEKKLPIFPDEVITIMSFSIRVDKDKLDILRDVSYSTVLYTEHGNIPYVFPVFVVACNLVDRAKEIAAEITEEKISLN